MKTTFFGAPVLKTGEIVEYWDRCATKCRKRGAPIYLKIISKFGILIIRKYLYKSYYS